MKMFETWQPADLRREILTLEKALLSTVAGASTADAGSFTQKQRADMEAMLKQLKARLYEKTGEGSPPSGGLRVIQVLTR